MAYKYFEIPSRNGERSDTVYADFEFPDRPCFTHYAQAVGFEAGDWAALTKQRCRSLRELRQFEREDFQKRFPEVVRKIRDGEGYWPGEGAMGTTRSMSDIQSRTAMRLGALELIGNIFSGRIAANDKDPFPHQLALQQHMRKSQGSIQRLLIADEVGLGKTIEVGMVLRDILVGCGKPWDFSCIYFTSGGLVADACGKLQSVIKGTLGPRPVVNPVDSFVGLRGVNGEIRVASMHAARRYVSDEQKKKLAEKIAPDIVIIDECHHCASDSSLAGVQRVYDGNATMTYIAAHQLMTGTFWRDSKPPKLVILMSATPFRSRAQFANLLRLLTHKVDNFDAYAVDADERRLLDVLNANNAKASVVWRRQDDPGVKSWRETRLFPNLKVVRPHKDSYGGPPLEMRDPAYIKLIEDITQGVRSLMKAHGLPFAGWNKRQLDTRLTSSSLAGACALFALCVRHSAWGRKEDFSKDTSESTRALRQLLIKISQALAKFDDQNSARHADVAFPSDGFKFSAAHIGAKGSLLTEIYDYNKKLRLDKDNEFLASSEEIQGIADLGHALIDFSVSSGNGVENAKLNWLQEMLRKYPERRFLVFTESLQTCSIIESAMRISARRLTGDMGQSERDRVVGEFRDPRKVIRVLVATSAADEGLDLQIANQVVHWDLSPSPAILMQRNGRVARLGQISDVTAYYLIVPGTHEERRDSALLERFEDLGICDERMRLKILGNLSEEDQARLDEAVAGRNDGMVDDVLKIGQKANKEMDDNLGRVRTEINVTQVLSRDDLAARLQQWSDLGLPEEIDDDDVKLRFAKVPWQRPVFGERATLEPAQADVATITCQGQPTNVTFDPEFKVFASESRAHCLAGMRPWSIREADGQLRPDEKNDPIGSLACKLARQRHADFAYANGAEVAGKVPCFKDARYLLFAVHPMRECETRESAKGSPSLTVYGFDARLAPLNEAKGADASQVKSIILLIENMPRSLRAALLDQHERHEHEEAGKKLRDWLEKQAALGGDIFSPNEFFLPIPVALVAVR